MHAEALSQALALCLSDYTVTAVTLVANEQTRDARRSVLGHFCSPISDMLKALSVCYIKHDEDAISATVVRAGDGAKPLLACRVPLKKVQSWQRARVSKVCVASRVVLHGEVGGGCVPGLDGRWRQCPTYDLKLHSLVIYVYSLESEVYAQC